LRLDLKYLQHDLKGLKSWQIFSPCGTVVMACRARMGAQTVEALLFQTQFNAETALY